MNLGRTVFSQLVNFFPTYHFQICVDRYQGNRYVLWHQRERGEDSSLGGRLRLRAGGDCQKAVGAGVEPLQNLADSQRDRFRENPHFRRVFQLRRRVPGRRVLYAIESIRLLMGQHCPVIVISRDPQAALGTGVPSPSDRQVEILWTQMQRELTQLSSRGVRLLQRTAITTYKSTDQMWSLTRS